MRFLVLYDIPDDRARSHVADACLDYGLERIQYSAFAGPLERVYQRELELKIRGIVGREPANVRFITLDERAWEHQRMIERTAPPSAPSEKEAAHHDV